jgi:hypothetical protein
LALGLCVAGPAAADPPAPVVTGVSPDDGPAAGGALVTIIGTGFTNATTVKFAQQQGRDSLDAQSFTVESDTEIAAVSPAANPAAGIAHVIVTGPGGESQPNRDDRFGYGPVVDQIEPNHGPAAGGTSVTVSGFGLAGASAVSFGPTPALGFSENPDGSITAVSPPVSGDNTVAPITVTTAEGQSLSFAFAEDARTPGYFDYGPTVTGVSPNRGPLAGGTVVTIRGTGFENQLWQGNGGFNYNVLFGSTRVQYEVVSNTEIRAISPPGSGTQDITVETVGGISPIVPEGRFIYGSFEEASYPESLSAACVKRARRAFRVAVARAKSRRGTARAAALRRARRHRRGALARCRG